ncbi:MAG: hypothetical protein AAF587_12940 [Bacteroidota bacterium]
MSNNAHPYVDATRIDFINPKAERVFHKRMQSISDFSQLRTRHLGDDFSRYGKQMDRFFYQQPIQQLWQAYTQQALYQMWPGPLVQFLFAYSKPQRQIYYASDTEGPAVHTGLQVYCLLNVAGPIGVVGMEVMDINPETYTIELAYIEGGMFRGLQRLEMVEQVLGGTQIIHSSYYRPEKTLGWLLPYKYFHNKTTHEFHNNIQQLLNNTSHENIQKQNENSLPHRLGWYARQQHCA